MARRSEGRAPGDGRLQSPEWADACFFDLHQPASLAQPGADGAWSQSRQVAPADW